MEGRLIKNPYRLNTLSIIFVLTVIGCCAIALLSSTLSLAQTQKEGSVPSISRLKPAIRTPLKATDLSRDFKRLLQVDDAIKALHTHLKSKGFEAQAGVKNYWGTQSAYKKEGKEIVTTVRMQDYTKAASKDVAAIGQVTVTTGDRSQTHTYSFYLFAPNGNFELMEEYKIDKKLNILKANSWWGCVKKDIYDECGKPCIGALVACAPTSPTIAGYIACVAGTCGTCALGSFACCACDCSILCKWLVGCCDLGTTFVPPVPAPRLGTARFNAIWVKNNTDQQAVRGWAPADFDKLAEELRSQGYQLTRLNAFVLPGQQGERYNAIWVKSSAEHLAIRGFTRADFDKQDEELRSQGYQLRDLNAFVLPGQQGERYNATWVKSSADQQAVWGFARADFVKKAEELRSQGYQPVRLNAFVLPGQQGERYNAIWVRSRVEHPVVGGWAQADFDKKAEELRSQGYQLQQLNAFVLPGQQGERFNAIWLKSSVEHPAVRGWAQADFDKKAEELRSQGYRLLDLNAFVVID